MEEDIQNYSRTKMFRGTPCIGFNRYYYYETSVCAKTQFLYYFFWLRTNYVTKNPFTKIKNIKILEDDIYSLCSGSV